jgi:hypothetical protein
MDPFPPFAAESRPRKSQFKIIAKKGQEKARRGDRNDFGVIFGYTRVLDRVEGWVMMEKTASSAPRRSVVPRAGRSGCGAGECGDQQQLSLPDERFAREKIGTFELRGVDNQVLGPSARNNYENEI